MALSTSGTHWHDSNRGVSLYITVYLILFSVTLVLGKLLHDHPRVAALIPEAGMVILVGMVAGLFIWLFGGGDNDNDASGDTYANYANGADDVYVQNADYNNLDDNYKYEQQMNQQQQSGTSYDDMAHDMLSFSPTVFFVVLLPPIIFNSGYHIHRDLFFRNIKPICLFAFAGTAICCVVVASLLYGLGWALFPTVWERTSYLELLTFGALISATDPVSTLAIFSSKRADPHLFYLVFGESVLNDAVGLVLFDALAHLLENKMNGLSFSVGEEIAQFLYDFGVAFVGSLALGILFSVFVALLLKLSDFRRTPLLELAIMASLMYFPFTIAEIMHLSGIVTVLFAGIGAKRYVEPNLSLTTQINADWVFRLMAHVTETIIFLELGLSAWQLLGGGAFSLGFLLSALVACLIGRAVNVYPLTLLFNLLQRSAICSKRQNIKKQTDPDGHCQDADRASTTNFTALDAPDDESNKPSNDKRHLGDQKKAAASAAVDEEEEETGKDDSIIPLKTAHMLWFSGLRGAVSYGLVRTFPATENKTVIVVTTMLLVLSTTFVLGGTTEWMLNYLQIPVDIDENEYLERLQRRKLLPGFMLRFENQKLYKWVTRRPNADTNGDGIIGMKKNKNDNDVENDEEVYGYESGDNLGSPGDEGLVNRQKKKLGIGSGDNDEDSAGYDEIEVTMNDLHRQRSTIINRKGKIFDYGA